MNTSPTSDESTAAWYPDPVPISSTRSVGRGRNACVIAATMNGLLIVCASPIGSDMSKYARGHCEGGMKQCRGVDSTAASTPGSVTPAARIRSSTICRRRSPN